MPEVPNFRIIVVNIAGLATVGVYQASVAIDPKYSVSPYGYGRRYGKYYGRT